ncbi:hypothetical protein CC86DRAFT_371133 [Ophiobolus disseminans]|uniref:NACHT domain-containing protein n=1 Tax=Ophiobolus disseminans TaxID=1469910 RepID=A0A6A6ZX97_9PLEO|nr:hypothetical protein CC86DRAFT_371133 [Ophiobolus disseminans]
MRLLKYEENGDITVISFNDNTIPPYAILSHTWGADTEEVTFVDLQNGDGKNKPGYRKIRFCGQQAQQDSLQYFWVDTCCINKSDKAELSLAIQSMFGWYQNATKCYAYLPDVSVRGCISSSTPSNYTWESAFKSSRWFKRGWTLQELIAPCIVEFFSEEWEKLGDKVSLKSFIRETTGIPHKALARAPLSQFSVPERLRWKGDRETKREEDAWYSMSGIFDVEIAPAYSEGAASAFGRLMDEIHTQERCIQDVRHTDPRDDKRRIEDTKGGLLVDSYRWVLDNTTFQQWQQDPHSRLLWVKGDPGKGKTMLLCGIVDELHTSMPSTTLLSYFFCQATDSRINSATAVLRGLLYMLIVQQPSLILHVRKKHDHAGKTLFEDANAWVVLIEIWADVLQDPSLRTAYMIIDALDECVTDLPRLLEFVAKQSSASSRVKWIVSSRNWPEIEAQLERAGHKAKLSLELNAQSVAAAVAVFIQRKVDQLAQEKQYRADVRHAVLQHLTSNANDTFLWVALVCQELRVTANRHVLKKLALFPPGLDALYKRMMQQMRSSIEDVEPPNSDLLAASRYPCIYWIDHLCDSKPKSWAEGVCDLQVAAVSVFLQKKYLYWLEGLSLCKSVGRGVVSMTKLWSLVQELGDQEGLTQLVQDARRFIMYHKGAIEGYPLQTYASALLFSPTGSMIRQLFQHEEPEGINVRPTLSNGWSACLQTLEGHSGPVSSVAFSPDSMQLASASDDRTVKIWDASSGATVKIWDASSGACLQTLEGHSSYVSSVAFSPVSSVAFSPDSMQLASASYDRTVKIWDASSGASSASYDRTVKIWDASSGACLQTLEGHSEYVSSVAFSPDSMQLASASGDRTVKIWDASSGTCLQTLEGHSDYVNSVAFSPDSTQLASASYDRAVKIWDASSGACLQTLKGHSDYVSSVAFSPDSMQLASASGNRTVKIWDASSGACLQTLEGYSRSVSSAELISILALRHSAKIITKPQESVRQEATISSDNIWVSDNVQKLWLPTEYRPVSAAVSGRCVGVGTGSGKVWICCFK